MEKDLRKHYEIVVGLNKRSVNRETGRKYISTIFISGFESIGVDKSVTDSVHELADKIMEGTWDIVEKLIDKNDGYKYMYFVDVISPAIASNWMGEVVSARKFYDSEVREEHIYDFRAKVNIEADVWFDNVEDLIDFIKSRIEERHEYWLFSEDMRKKDE